MFFGSVLEHSVNLLDVKRKKTCVSGMNALFWGTEVTKIISHHASILIPWTNNDICVCFREFCKPSECKMKKSCVSGLMHYLGYRSCKNYFPPNASILIPHTNNGVCECFGSFRNPWNVK
jgi:hypothetical protein